MSDDVTVRMVCPRCSKVSRVKVSHERFSGNDDTGLVTVSFDQPCGHSCLLFIDKNLKQRGGSCADHAVEATGENGIEVQLFDDATWEISGSVNKLATELILMCTKDMEYIKSINAGEKISQIERALINGDIKKAGSLLGKLWTFAKEIDELEFADRLQLKLKKINEFLIEHGGFSWEKIILKDDPRLLSVEREKIKALRAERIQKVISELHIEMKLGTFSAADFEGKKAALLQI